MLQRIADAVNPAPDRCGVEIGPGTGALTALLLQKLPHLHAIEIDRDLARICGDVFAERLACTKAMP